MSDHYTEELDDFLAAVREGGVFVADASEFEPVADAIERLRTAPSAPTQMDDLLTGLVDWECGVNDRPHGGPYMVRLEFDDPQSVKKWVETLLLPPSNKRAGGEG